MKTSQISAALLLTGALALAPAARAAVDAFIWFEDQSIRGESNDPKHLKWIEIESFQIDQFRQAASTIGSATGGAGAGKVKFNEFTIKKTTDAASASLRQASTSGKHFPKVLLSMRKAGGSAEYLEYKLENVMISSYQLGGPDTSGKPTETMTLNFSNASLGSQPALQVAPASAALLSAGRTITKVTPSAATATTGQTITFHVEGTGNCTRSRIDFGDGTNVEFVFTAGKSQPDPTHAYTKNGAFDVRAFGLADPWAKLSAPPPSSENVCSGHASATVAVRAIVTKAVVR
jgi:type VI secretion system secreted protein Hcp